jgi:formylglycine-generating enzyme required for sulfatase activity
MVCVDWCDAYAYCKAVGKRLCGKIGGGSNAFGAPADASMSQWYRACSMGGTRPYPYGGMYSDTACVGDAYDGAPGYQFDSDMPQEVGTVPTCEGGYPGVFDLSGNMKEWEDSCESTNGQADKCYRRGGSYKENASALTCAAQIPSARSSTTIDLSFRCCAETVK